MNGARENYNIISEAARLKIGYLRKLNRDDAWYIGSEVYINGNIIYGLSNHARGKCFHIYLAENTYDLTDKEIVSRDNCLEVYGVLGGQNGWTEYYGWKHTGNWVEPITDYLNSLKSKITLHYEKIEEDKRLKEAEVQKQTKSTVNRFNKLFV